MKVNKAKYLIKPALIVIKNTQPAILYTYEYWTQIPTT